MLEPGGNCVRWALAPIGGPARRPLKSTMRAHPGQGPPTILQMIAGEAELGPVAHDPSEQIEIFSVDKSALVMPSFRPRIRKEQKNPVKHSRCQLWQQGPHIFVKNPDVGEFGLINEPGERRNPIAERFTPEKPDVGVSCGLGGEMLAGTKPDFEPNRRGRREQGRRVAARNIGRQDPESVKHRLEPRAAARAKGMAAAAPVEMGFVGGLGARGVNHP